MKTERGIKACVGSNPTTGAILKTQHLTVLGTVRMDVTRRFSENNSVNKCVLVQFFCHNVIIGSQSVSKADARDKRVGGSSPSCGAKVWRL